MSEPALSARRGSDRDPAAFYESQQEWPSEVTGRIAQHLRDSAGTGPRSAVFLGCATGVNDALPFARTSPPGERVVASDLDPAYLDKLAQRVRSERLGHVDVRKADVTEDLRPLGAFDVAALFFVIHRVADWRKAVPGLVRLVAPGGSLFTSEFAGPGGMIHLSNENGGWGRDPISRLIRRTFELAPERFAPPLKSSCVRPFLEALAGELTPFGFQDFAWRQSLTVGEMFGKIEARAYAPYRTVGLPRTILDQVRAEFAPEWSQRCELVETIRIYRFRREIA